jgi:hypothetical protein
MTQMRIKRFNESAEEGDMSLRTIDFEEAKRWIVDNYEDSRVVEMLDDEILEWVDREGMEEEGYESEYDWYIDYGRGEAESAVTEDIVGELKRNFELTFDPISGDTNLYEFLRQAYQCLDY